MGLQKGMEIEVHSSRSISGFDEEKTEPEPEPETEAPTENITYTVTFINQGNVFATRTVATGERASQPLLLPAPGGRWNFDFSSSIYEDTRIEFTE